MFGGRQVQSDALANNGNGADKVQLKSFVDPSEARRHRENALNKIRRNNREGNLAKRRRAARMRIQAGSDIANRSSAATAVVGIDIDDETDIVDGLTDKQIQRIRAEKQRRWEDQIRQRFNNPALIEQMTAAFNSTSKTIRVSALQEVCHALYIPNPPINRVLAVPGFLAKVGTFLRDDNKEVVTTALSTLVNLSSTDDKNVCRALIEARAVETVVGMMRDGAIENFGVPAAENAIWFIANVAADDVAYRDAFVRNGVVEAVLRYLTPQAADDTVGTIAHCVLSFMRWSSESPLPFEQYNKLIGAVDVLLASDDPVVVCDALESLSMGLDFPPTVLNPQTKQMVQFDSSVYFDIVLDKNPNILRRCITLFGDINTMLEKMVARNTPVDSAMVNEMCRPRKPIVNFLCHLVCSAQQRHSNVAIGAGFLRETCRAIMCPLQSNYKSGFYWALSNIASDTHENAVELIRSGVLPFVTRAIREGKRHTRLESVFVFANLAHKLESIELCKITTKETVLAMYETFDHADIGKNASTCKVALEYFDLLFAAATQVCQLSKNANNLPIQWILEKDDASTFHDLANHPTDAIAEKAEHIIDTHFTSEVHAEFAENGTVGRDDDDDDDDDEIARVTNGSRQTVFMPAAAAARKHGSSSSSSATASQSAAFSFNSPAFVPGTQFVPISGQSTLSSVAATSQASAAVPDRLYDF